MKIIIVIDTWSPQINGFMRTLQATRRELELCGHHVTVITPHSFATVPCPGYIVHWPILLKPGKSVPRWDEHKPAA